MSAEFRREDVLIRVSNNEDIETITKIYAYYVLHGTASFETEPPTVEEMKARWENLLKNRYPHLVAEYRGSVVGYAYAGAYRPRTAYRHTVENSIYIHPEATGQGIGKTLLTALLKECEVLGLRQMIAVIGDSANIASIRLHLSLGFQLIGTLKSVGFKKGQWLDTVLLQRSLGAGDSTLPDGTVVHT